MNKELIKEYDPNIRDKEQIIEITVMIWGYIGHIYYPVNGNCKGKTVLDCADFESETFEDCEKDFVLEYDEDEDAFWAELNRADGSTLEGQWSGSELNDAIISLRFVN